MSDQVSAALESPDVSRSKKVRGLLILVGIALLIACISQLIGTKEIPLGKVSITILPMVYAIIIGAIVSAQKAVPFSIPLQNTANSLVSVAVLLVMVRLAFTIGPNLQVVIDAGPALLLQEVGHLIGTLVLALPLALLLGMGPATIGATFSIDREGSFAMVSEKYGSDSDEYRGVLAMYIFGTVFGAIVISLLVSVVSSLHWFNPLALAMGAGVGSGSMMGAATAVISDEYPNMEDQVGALAATSNVITTLLGVYVGFFIALPLAHKIYHLATKNKNSWLARHNNKAGSVSSLSADAGVPTGQEVTYSNKWLSIAIVMLMGVPVAWITDGKVTWEAPALYAIFAVLIYFGEALNYFGGKVSKYLRIPALLTVVTLGVLLSSPWSPVSAQMAAIAKHVDFVSICTLMLSLAGLSLGKDIGLLRQISWKIIPVGLVAILSSYIFSVIVAEFVLGYWQM
jgi:MFS family permease